MKSIKQLVFPSFTSCIIPEICGVSTKRMKINTIDTILHHTNVTVASDRQKHSIRVSTHWVTGPQFLAFWVKIIPFYFFQNSQGWHYWHFYVTSTGSKLEIVANQINLNTNAALKRMSLVTSSNSFSYLSNTKMPIMPTLGYSKNFYQTIRVVVHSNIHRPPTFGGTVSSYF